MHGALTQLRLYAARAAALRALRDAEPAGEARDAELARELAKAAGFAAAAPYFAGPHRRDVADAALAALGRDRDLAFRIVFQAGLGALFAAGLASAGARLTTLLALFSAFLALPTWALAFGGPSALVEGLLAAPLGGRAARDLLHARLLSVLALLLGAETDPAAARAVAESLVGARLPESALASALTRRGFEGKVALRPEAEDALLRAAAHLTRAAQIRFRFLILGVAAIGLVALFAGGVTVMRDQGLLPGAPRPEGAPTYVPAGEDRERPGTFVMPPPQAARSTATSGSP